MRLSARMQRLPLLGLPRWQMPVVAAVVALLASGDAAADVHTVPLPPRGDAVTTGAAPGFHLGYFGGPVVEQLAVVQVLWGTGDFAASVARTSSPSIATFYEHVLASAYVDWLVEYDTPSQHIGHGRFVGQFRIAPAPTSGPLDDSAVVAELGRQIVNGHLPAADANTLYVVFFPRGIPVTTGQLTTCVDVCGWHGSAPSVAGVLRYSVQPDLRSPCQCHVDGNDELGDATRVGSHELLEAITDPDVSRALAWYDVSPGAATFGGEIADLCIREQATISGGDGVTYVVQKAWSNALDACVATGTAVCGDGTVTIGEECDDGNVVAGDGCSPSCTFEGAGCPPWHFVADVTVPASFFAVPGDPSRQSGAQETDDGRVLVNKDVGGERWAIVLDDVLGTVTGNVFDATSGDATFIECTPLPTGALRCLGTASCRGDARQSGVQLVPSGRSILVSKDVGGERWAIGRRELDLSVTGNVYAGPSAAPTFLRCDAVGGDPNVLDCFASPPCSGLGTDCESLWQFVARVTDLPTDFFQLPID